MKEDASWVVVYDHENEKMLGPHALLCVHASGISLLLHDSMDAYATRQGSDHYVYHNAAMTIIILNWCPASTATRECSSTRKGPRRCANRLVGSYSHVWTVCREIKYTSNCSLG